MRKFLRHRKSRILAAFVLVLCLLLTLPLIPKGVAQADSLNLDESCSLTIKPGTVAEEDKDGVKVQIDLYKVADAVDVGGYETYKFEVKAPYQSLKEDLANTKDLDNDKWQKLAQQAAQLTLKTDGTQVNAQVDTAAKDVPAGEAISGLKSGLYLVIAKGEGVTNYVDATPERFMTKAYSKKYCYTYLPELVALPSTTDFMSGDRKPVMTSDGTWKYNLTATLKPEQSKRFAPLDLVKVLTGYEKNTPATFVFEVKVYESKAAKEAGSEPIDTNVYAIDFDAAGEKQIHIADRIPIGAYVVVTELYSGSFYEPQGSTTQEFEMTEEGGRVTFVNDYSENPPPGDNGGSIVNHFEFEKSESHNGGTGTDEAVNTEGSTGTTGTWQWTQLRDNTAE
ncbi:MAG: hypothetical protein HFI41_07650 [Lachnospiraceae bacterium]|nr:hypothetical protein [Lachnospiraceae bacterium]